MIILEGCIFYIFQTWFLHDFTFWQYFKFLPPPSCKSWRVGCREGRRQCLATTDGSSSPLLLQIFYIFIRTNHTTKAPLYSGQIWRFLLFRNSHDENFQSYIFVDTFHIYMWKDRMYKCILWTMNMKLDNVAIKERSEIVFLAFLPFFVVAVLGPPFHLFW